MPELRHPARVVATASGTYKRTWTCTAGVPGTNAVLVPVPFYNKMLRRETELRRLLRNEAAAKARQKSRATKAVVAPSIFSCKMKRKKKSNAQTNQTPSLF